MRNVQLAALTAIALAVSAAHPAAAHLVGVTYDFDTSTTGNTAIGAPSGTFTDPSNPGFCVGPPVACGSGSGVSGSFAFADVSPGSSTITFTFFGSTAGAGPGSFLIDLSNFATTDGERITGITYSSGNFTTGDFSSVSFNGTTAVFTGSTATDYNALGGRAVVFDVSTVVPEPSTWALLLMGFVGLGYAAYHRSTKGKVALT
jgi:hypothetical protein